MNDIVEKDHQRLAVRFKKILATYQKAEDLISIGAYASGSNPEIDEAIHMIDAVRVYLRQDIETSVTFEQSVAALRALFPG
jgi:flagellum-specific ATP synthase